VVGGIEELAAVLALYRAILDVFSAEGTPFITASWSLPNTPLSYPAGIVTGFVVFCSLAVMGARFVSEMLDPNRLAVDHEFRKADAA
jgi:hypothetical protein